ncbi:MAG TPA: LpqB family beta-propeller domain-containing protein, partial [Ilumatobacteraceae bacterium]|nr:LpqB family beta-propeller domain-containing protein [Ilumatobacteraceae bacterium]
MNHKQIAERIIGNLGSVSSPAVSPDGRHVAFVATRTDLAENRYESQIWLARTDGSSAARRVSAGQRAGSPAWSPDGSLLAFVSGRA